MLAREPFARMRWTSGSSPVVESATFDPSAMRSAPFAAADANRRRARGPGLAPHLVLHHFPALHHPLHALELGDVLERVAGDRHQVRELAGLDRAHLLRPADHLRGGAGG